MTPAAIEKFVAAVHEAGHAMGRLLTADDMGHTWGNAVVSINMGHPAGPITYGPLLHKAWDDNSDDCSEDAIRRLIEDARASGADVERWGFVKVLHCVFGPAAEAKFCRKPFNVIWYRSTSANDRNCAIGDCARACISADHAIASAIPIALRALDQPDVWQAVRAIASAAHAVRKGSLAGAAVAAIARKHITGASEALGAPSRSLHISP